MPQKIETCVGDTEIRSDGTFEFKPKNLKSCKKILDKLNPIKGRYWKRHIEKLKHEVTFNDLENI